MTVKFQVELSEKTTNTLKQLAERTCWGDEADLDIDGCAGGNIDDAYYGGWVSGEVAIARLVLDDIGIPYKKEE